MDVGQNTATRTEREDAQGRSLVVFWRGLHTGKAFWYIGVPGYVFLCVISAQLPFHTAVTLQEEHELVKVRKMPNIRE